MTVFRGDLVMTLTGVVGSLAIVSLMLLGIDWKPLSVPLVVLLLLTVAGVAEVLDG